MAQKKAFYHSQCLIILERICTDPSMAGLLLDLESGDGKNILLGVDPFVGVQSSLLPEDLRSYLEDLDICTLS